MASIRLIIDLDLTLSRSRDNPSGIKLHCRDWILIPIDIKDAPSAEIPNTDAAVEGASDEVDVVELEAGDGGGVADEGAVDLAGAEIPEADHSVGGAAGEGRVEALDGTDEVGLFAGAGGGPAGGVGVGDERVLGSGPEDVEGLYAAAGLEVPLSEGLVGGAGDEGVVLKVEGGDFGDVGIEGVHAAVVEGDVVGGVVGGFAGAVVFGAREIPDSDGCIHGSGGDKVVFDLEAADRGVVAFEETEAASVREVPNSDSVVESGGYEGAKGDVKVEGGDGIAVGLELLDVGSGFKVFVKDGHGDALWRGFRGRLKREGEILLYGLPLRALEFGSFL